MKFLNYYLHCRNQWTDEWNCMCNDQCPICHAKDIEPYQSQELNGDGTLGDIIRHVPTDWIPEQGWPDGNARSDTPQRNLSHAARWVRRAGKFILETVSSD